MLTCQKPSQHQMDQRPRPPSSQSYAEEDAVSVGSHSGFGENDFLMGRKPIYPDTPLLEDALVFEPFSTRLW